MLLSLLSQTCVRSFDLGCNSIGEEGGCAGSCEGWDSVLEGLGVALGDGEGLGLLSQIWVRSFGGWEGCITDVSRI